MTAPTGGSRADRPVLGLAEATWPSNLARSLCRCGGVMSRDKGATGDPFVCEDCGALRDPCETTDAEEWEISKLLGTPTWPREDAPLIYIPGRTPERCERDGRVVYAIAVIASYAAAVGLGYLWGSM